MSIAAPDSPRQRPRASGQPNDPHHAGGANNPPQSTTKPPPRVHALVRPSALPAEDSNGVRPLRGSLGTLQIHESKIGARFGLELLGPFAFLRDDTQLEPVPVELIDAEHGPLSA